MTQAAHEFDCEQWWEICRHARPDLERVEFDRLWADFQRLKEAHALT